MTRGPDFFVFVIVDKWEKVDGRIEPTQITLRSPDGAPLTATDIRAAKFDMQIQEQRSDYVRSISA